MSQKNQSRLFLTFTISLSLFIIILFKKDTHHLQSFLASTGPATPLVIILLFGLLSITPFPPDPLALINGALFGPVYGTLVSLTGNNFAAIIEYYLGTKINIATNFDKQKKHLPFNLDHLPANSFIFLFFGRFIPGFGGKLVSLTAGIYRVNFWRFAWTTCLANILGSLLYAAIGHSILNLV